MTTQPATPTYNQPVRTPDGQGILKDTLYSQGRSLLLVAFPPTVKPSAAAEAWGGTDKSRWTLAAYNPEQVQP